MAASFISNTQVKILASRVQKLVEELFAQTETMLYVVSTHARPGARRGRIPDHQRRGYFTHRFLMVQPFKAARNTYRDRARRLDEELIRAHTQLCTLEKHVPPRMQKEAVRWIRALAVGCGHTRVKLSRYMTLHSDAVKKKELVEEHLLKLMNLCYHTTWNYPVCLGCVHACLQNLKQSTRAYHGAIFKLAYAGRRLRIELLGLQQGWAAIDAYRCKVETSKNFADDVGASLKRVIVYGGLTELPSQPPKSTPQIQGAFARVQRMCSGCKPWAGYVSWAWWSLDCGCSV